MLQTCAARKPSYCRARPQPRVRRPVRLCRAQPERIDLTREPSVDFSLDTFSSSSSESKNSLDSNGYKKDSWLAISSDNEPWSENPRKMILLSSSSSSELKEVHSKGADSDVEEVSPTPRAPNHCDLCHGGNDPAQLLTCTGCGLQRHIYCEGVRPENQNTPWRCLLCVGRERLSNANGKRGRPPTSASRADKRTVLELSITVSRKGRDVSVHAFLQFAEWMRTHCMAGAASVERGDALQHQHIQASVSWTC